jgi:hypothetical protein
MIPGIGSIEGAQLLILLVFLISCSSGPIGCRNSEDPSG